MNTTGIQNYLSNVFRPIVVFDTATSNFVPKLELSNIDNISGNTVTVVTAEVGDQACNVYVGKQAGNLFNLIRGVSNTTAVGFAAGNSISNVSNSVFLGFSAGSNTTINSPSSLRDIIAIGYNAGLGPGGNSNIYIGSEAGSGVGGRLGTGNIFIGHGISPTSNVSNQLRIGRGGNIPIAANLLTNWVGLGGSPNPLDANNKLDVAGNVRIQGNVGINITPGVRTLDVNGNFRVRDASSNQIDLGNGTIALDSTTSRLQLGFGTFTVTDSSTNQLQFANGLTRSSEGFTSIRGSNVISNGGNGQIVGASLRNGMIMVAVSSGSANFDGRLIFVLDSVTPTPIVSNMCSNKSATTTINYQGSNIRISNTTGGELTYKWTITYFPLP